LLSDVGRCQTSLLSMHPLSSRIETPVE
jgi:hypothetical protein